MSSRLEWAVDRLRPHPENSAIFGDPEEDEAFDGLLTSIRKDGIFDELLVKANGTIVCGHLRYAVAKHLRMKHVPVRVIPEFAQYKDELRMLITSNTERRKLSPSQIAQAFKRLRETPASEGGAKKKMGRPDKSGSSSGLSKGDSRDDAAKLLGVGEQEARALETVFTTPGVPEELKAAVNSGKVKPTPAARAVRDEIKKQGGTIADTSHLKEVATPAKKSDHEKRVATDAEQYTADHKALFEHYKAIDRLLTKRPLASVIGSTEHHEYAGLIRDLSLRAWREIESVQGGTAVGKQMRLTVIDGGAR